MLVIEAGETVRLKFKAHTPGGKVIRPPASAVVTLEGTRGDLALLGDAAWDGYHWELLADTSSWPPGVYQACAQVSGPDGAGQAKAVIQVLAPAEARMDPSS